MESFPGKLRSALDQVRRILDDNRRPCIPIETPHRYEDKYLLAQFLSNTALAAHLNCLEALGLDDKKLHHILSWGRKRTLTIRLRTEEKCQFLREQKRKVVSPTEHVTEITGFIKATISEKTSTTVYDYFWKFEVLYELSIYEGNNPDKKVVLQGRRGELEILTSQKVAPRKESTISTIEGNLTWLFLNISDDMVFKFAIDRDADSCHTPRRNQDIEAGLRHFVEFRSWCERVEAYFLSTLFPVHLNHGYDLAKINDSGVFVPVLALFDETADSKTPPKETKALVALHYERIESVVMPVADLNRFLDEEKRSLNEKFSEIAKMIPDDGKVITRSEANFVVIVKHGQKITLNYQDSIYYIEDMLYKQLLAAIGKEVTPSDFTNYMKFHNQQLFREKYAPAPFCYAVRRPDHYPEGTVMIEAQLSDGSLAEPLYTMVHSTVAKYPMSFALNAATKVSFYGERHLHAWVAHEFSGNSGLQLKLVARARQFSSFIMLVGAIGSADTFEPKCGLIIQNKDELNIPLWLEQIPTPKEFRDAIESLSPEQQRFCKAYRSMQLASTLFGIVIIQIKPQLEKLLKIPNDSLTKEIKLTQDLLELFIKYQIPSDLLSYGGDPSALPDDKITAVKKHVLKMQEMIKISRETQLKEQQKIHAYENVKYEKNEILFDDDEDFQPRKKSTRKKKSDYKEKEQKAPQAKGRAAPQKQLSSNTATLGAVSAVPTPVTETPPPSESTEIIEKSDTDKKEYSISIEEGPFDYTKIPPLLDEKYESLDEDSALRPTIIKLSDSWTKKSYPSLLSDPIETILHTNEQTTERNAAFDLLDALSRSGALTVDQACLHVVIGATHCFDKTITDTVIQKNVNPIEKVERSLLIMATTIYDQEASELVRPEQIERVSTYSPVLFGLPSLKERKALEGKK